MHDFVKFIIPSTFEKYIDKDYGGILGDKIIMEPHNVKEHYG